MFPKEKGGLYFRSLHDVAATLFQSYGGFLEHPQIHYGGNLCEINIVKNGTQLWLLPLEDLIFGGS